LILRKLEPSDFRELKKLDREEAARIFAAANDAVTRKNQDTLYNSVADGHHVLRLALIVALGPPVLLAAYVALMFFIESRFQIQLTRGEAKAFGLVVGLALAFYFNTKRKRQLKPYIQAAVAKAGH
jgi:hypothetical protein